MEITHKIPNDTFKWSVWIIDEYDKKYFVFGSFKTKKQAKQVCKHLNKTLIKCSSVVIKNT